jgi:hypothetical protein
MADTLTARDQTLTHFGLNGDAFALLAQATARGAAGAFRSAVGWL